MPEQGAHPDIGAQCPDRCGGRALGSQREDCRTVTEPAEPVRDRGAIAEAIRALSPRDWLRLHRKAGLYAGIIAGLEPDDLLQEVIRRALDGERQCPVSVEVTYC